RLPHTSAWSITEARMVRLRTLCCAVAVAAVAVGCASKRHSAEQLGAKDTALPDNAPGYSVPLDLREFDVAPTDSGYRGVVPKLSRLPGSVVASSQTDPPRIIVDIQGPTGTESAEEVYPAGDTLVTHVGVTRQLGWLRVILDLQSEQMPEYAVYPMAD